MNRRPDGWSNTTLGKIATISSGGTPSRSRLEYWNGDIPWITTSAINFGTINAAEEHITAAGLANSSAKLFPQGTLLMAMYGQGMTRGRVGVLGIPAATNQACAAIRVSGDCSGPFVYYALEFQYHSIRELGHGGNQKNLNQSLIEAIPIALPPLPEQRKIAEILGTWDAAIGRVEQLIAALQRRKQGLMQRLLTGVVRFPEFVGTEWEEKELSELVEPVFRPETVEPGKEYRLIGVRWYLEGAHVHDTVSGDSFVSQSLSRIEENDILYNKMWVSKAAFAVAKPEHAGAYGTGEYPQFRAKAGLDARFLSYAFHVPRFQHDATALCRGTTGRIRLHPRDFLQLKISLPSLAEQRKIAEFFATVDKEIALQQQRLAQLQAQKKGLMQRLLTGQVRVKVGGE